MVFPVIGGDGKPTGYEIENSYRIDQGSAVGMARFGNNSRNGNTFTISFWIKRTKLGEFQTIVTSKVEDSGVNSFLMTFQSNDTIKVQGQPASGTGSGAGRDYIQTNAVFRDPSAWYHIVYRQDTTQSTSTDRHRIYVNGVQQSTSVYNPLDQNVGDAYFYNANSYPYAIGNDERDNDYGNFYMAEHHYTDGVSNAPTEFGETNDNGVWIPKKYTGSHGSYGHYLKFENASGGSGTTAVGGHNYTTGSSSTIGADSSGNNNHFHVQGYSAEDNTTDTPTNNFCTFSSISVAGGGLTDYTSRLSEGNLIADTTNNSDDFTYLPTFATNMPFYFEMKFADVHGGGNDQRVGIIRVEKSSQGGSHAEAHYRRDGNIHSIDNAGNNVASVQSGKQVITDNDIIGVAVDNTTNNNVKFYHNGSLQGTIDILSTILYMPFVRLYGNSTTTKVEANFGNPPFSISSGNSDANGYGNFEYAVPSGYYSLCTKNLAEYG
tara:strand:- start:3022 stop:4491 length:1470 start_codon:yes stop_codon:yes gene_type:complete